MPFAAKSKLVRRVPLREVCGALGISRATFYRHWAGVFTAYKLAQGGRLGECRFAEDEVLLATQHDDLARAKAAVYLLRREKGRMPEATR